MYAAGRGVPKDGTKAIEWYRKAADQGIAIAQSNLGSMYDTGDGIPEDDAKAAEWYRKAAEQGDADAQNSLGAMYANGTGVPKDYVEAYAWFGIAAAQGNPKAKGNGANIAARMSRSQIDQAIKKYREYWYKYVAPFQE